MPKIVFSLFFFTLLRAQPTLPSAAERSQLPPDGGPHWNRLVFESSPYLLAHAAQAVDWFPWGEEAFSKARSEDKPIFLSIGYSACHWCHVMARESFADARVAALLNKSYIAMKLDREERPDIDAHFMQICQAVTGQGGWPLTVILTPDKAAFFVGTYFPKEDRWGRMGLLSLLEKTAQFWKEQRPRMEAIAKDISAAIQARPSETALEGEQAMARAAAQLAIRYDAEAGGFGDAPKFPSANELLFLLRYSQGQSDPKWLAMVRNTLMKMRFSGLYDPLGAGFHRYTSDRFWRKPHFEKMLYDQALLVLLYLEAYQASGESVFAETARDCLDYVLERLRDKEGGFYCAESAESEGREGKYYLWSEAEIRERLAPNSESFIKTFGILAAGNFEPDSEQDREAAGLNLFYPQSGVEPAETKAQLLLLKKARDLRVHPERDDKILVSWNGLMIAAFARASSLLEQPRYLQAAIQAQAFIHKKMFGPTGEIQRVYREKASQQGQLEDYANGIWGLIELYQASFETKYLRMALEWQAKQDQLFADPSGGYFMAGAQAELPVRPQVFRDGAMPAGNSVAAYNLMRLSRLTGEAAYEIRGEKLLERALKENGQTPQAACFMLCALGFRQGLEVVLVGEPKNADFKALEKVLRAPYLPHAVMLCKPLASQELTALAPFTEGLQLLEHKATAYVCSQFSCKTPTTQPQELAAQLRIKPVSGNDRK